MTADNGHVPWCCIFISALQWTRGFASGGNQTRGAHAGHGQLRRVIAQRRSSQLANNDKTMTHQLQGALIRPSATSEPLSGGGDIIHSNYPYAG